MNTKIRRVAFLALFLVGLPTGVLLAETASLSSIQTVVLGETGEHVSNARLFIYSKEKKEFFDVKSTDSQSVVNVPPGRYRVYAALTRNEGGIFEHYVSVEANVTVDAGEFVSVVLALQKTQEHEMNVSDSVIEKIQLSPELAKYIN